MTRTFKAPLVSGVCGLLLVAAAQAGAYPLDPAGPPVATGLDSPKGLTFGPDGNLYVAEAGRGGSGACITNPENQEVCFGKTGAITLVKNGVQRRIVSGLPSLAGAGGFAATGPHDVSAIGNDSLMVPIGLGSDPVATASGGALAGTGLGTLIRVDGRSGRWSKVADLGVYEGENNPDDGQPDTNPFGVLALPGRNLVADAGANAMLEVTPSGAVSKRAVFPDALVDAPPFLGLPPGSKIPMQTVPTAVAQAPNGDLYVSRLTGFPFPVGEARVVVIRGAGIVRAITGFTNVIDLTFGPDGYLYVVELSQSGLLTGQMDGAVWRVNPEADSKTDVSTPAELVANVQAPGGAAFGPDGDLYVTAGTILPGGGVVLKFDMP
ncbi:MAG: ScyD/ScyE family protein [Pseudomonadota bacterium]